MMKAGSLVVSGSSVTLTFDEEIPRVAGGFAVVYTAPGGDGGCSLASSGSGGIGFGALLLAMLPFAFCIGRKKKSAV